jgi:UDP-N-acetylmuramoylalanine--D-glutamate ligase
VIRSRAWSGKRYAVLGLARSGLATVEALLASGAEVVAWDSNPDSIQTLRSSRAKSRGVSAEQEAGAGQSVKTPFDKLRTSEVVFQDPLTLDLTGFAGVVVSPGVPLNRHPIAAHSRRFGVPIIGDIELFAQARPELPPHKVVGITGTNGKSTTTALVHHILKTAGVPSLMGGNIGLPILSADPLPEGGVYVLELSSFQIDLTHSLDCDVAVLLNITPDHLDRYESFEAYAAAKARLFEMQSDTHTAVIAIDDEVTKGIAVALQPDRPELVEADSFTSAASEERGGLRQAQADRLWVVSFTNKVGDWPSLKGPHNAQNLAAALAAVRALAVDELSIAEALPTYPGLPHRMERVAEKREVLFINDSKATNPDSTAPALAAYARVHWIVGGLAKTDSLGPCEQHLGHVRGAYTIGEAGPMFARLLAGRVPVMESGVLERAVRDAAAAAQPGEVVLLSPACASFDQFRDYEARGDAFRAAVGAL